MELLILFLICFGCFGFFALGEVIKLKKEVRRLNGIVTYLLEKEKANQESWEFVKFIWITLFHMFYGALKLNTCFHGEIPTQ